MTITDLPLIDQALVVRSSAHARAEAALQPDARLQDGVTDLHVARVVLALEQGALLCPSFSRGMRWTAPEGSPLQGMKGAPSLQAVVTEMIRLGLAVPRTERTGPASYRTYLAAALVHLKGEGDRPACGGPSVTIKRFRLVEDLTLVDCQACVDAVS